MQKKIPKKIPRKIVKIKKNNKKMKNIITAGLKHLRHKKENNIY